MRRNAAHSLLFLIVLLGLPSAVLCQAAPLDAEGAVRQALAHAKEGYTSTDVKELGWLGDASAVALTKIIGGSALEQSDIESILLIVAQSYSAPAIIKVDGDREPRATLFLLHSLSLSTTNAALHGKIDATLSYVRGQYARWLKSVEGPSQNTR